MKISLERKNILFLKLLRFLKLGINLELMFLLDYGCFNFTRFTFHLKTMPTNPLQFLWNMISPTIGNFDKNRLRFLPAPSFLLTNQPDLFSTYPSIKIEIQVL